MSYYQGSTRMMPHRCRECGEHMGRQSEITGVCQTCYHAMDMGRFSTFLPPVIKGPFACERCRDLGFVLEPRESIGLSYLQRVKCTECNKEE